MNARIADLIRESRTDEIGDAIEEGALLPHADLHAGADRARRLRGGRRGCRRERRHEPPRLPDLARASAEGAGGRDCAGGRRERLQRGRRRALAESPRGSSPSTAWNREAAARRGRRSRWPRSAGSAGADTFTLVRPTASAEPSQRLAPNPPGSVSVPPAATGRHRRCRRSRSPALDSSGAAPAPPTGSRGRCSPRSTRSSRTSGATWGRARRAPSAGCSSCRDTWLRWGVDADGNGFADPWNAADAIYAAARYLAASGGQSDVRGSDLLLQPRGLVRQRGARPGGALRRRAREGVIFKLDRLQVAVDDARKQVASSERTTPLREGRHAQACGRRGRACSSAPRRARLLSTKLVLEQRAARLTARRVAAERLVKKQHAALAAAQRALSAAREQMLAPSFSYPVASVLGAPAYSGDYVVPRRRRPRCRQRRAHAPRLPGRRHRRADRGPRLRARRGVRRPRLARAGPPLRHRPDDRYGRRPELDLLPPLVPGRTGSRPAPGSRPAHRSVSSGPPETPPARTSTCS